MAMWLLYDSSLARRDLHLRLHFEYQESKGYNQGPSFVNSTGEAVDLEKVLPGALEEKTLSSEEVKCLKEQDKKMGEEEGGRKGGS
ncbi:hypothetical protein K2173_004780 [Erythroxylum novogranatense]|uniref:Uncharacterized protein n=1 Tax=Erythroxylum novogranatense TaxID=1862640 RepID=A0AAV8SJR4_9ROSI|nr:hypothetical protein K2173_004780 [Erythroxylum novogranatense]